MTSALRFIQSLQFSRYGVETKNNRINLKLPLLTKLKIAQFAYFLPAVFHKNRIYFLSLFWTEVDIYIKLTFKLA